MAEIKNWQLGTYRPRTYEVTLLLLPTSKRKSEEAGRRPITVILGIDFLAGEQTLSDVAGRRVFFRRTAGRKGKALD